MATWELKCGDIPDQTYSVIMDNQTYDLRIKWIQRDQAWQAYLGRTGVAPSVSFKLTNGFNLLSIFYHKDAVPKGQLYMIDRVNFFGRPDFDQTGIDRRFTLVYFDEGELE